MMRFPQLAFACLVAAAMPTAVTRGQDALPDSKKSVVVFDLQIAKMRSGKLFQKVGGAEIVSEIQKSERMDEIDLNKVDRIIGSASAPPSINAPNEMQPGDDVPFEFFVRVIFSDAEAAQKLYDDFAKKSIASEKNGRTYLRPDSNRDPGNISICRLDPKTMEMGTDFYVMQKSRNFRTAKLSEAWSKLPAHAIRVALDLDSIKSLVDEGTKMAADGAPPQAMMAFDIISKISSLSAAIDMEADPVIALSIEGKSEDEATNLNTIFGGLLSMAKGMGQQMVGGIPDPDVKNAATSVLGSLNAKQEGKMIRLDIPRPDGFEEAIVKGIAGAKKGAVASSRRNDMKQLALAVHNYHAAFRRFPWEPMENGNDNLSWRARLLPFFEQQEMYEQMDISKGHDEAPNSQFAMQMPAVFGDNGSKTTVYTIAHEESPTSFRDIIDGTSNTIMLIRAPAKAAWLSPTDLTIDEAMEVITSVPAGQSTTVAFFDGSVRDIDGGTNADTVRAMLTYNGLEIINH